MYVKILSFIEDVLCSMVIAIGDEIERIGAED